MGSWGRGSISPDFLGRRDNGRGGLSLFTGSCLVSHSLLFLLVSAAGHRGFLFVLLLIRLRGFVAHDIFFVLRLIHLRHVSFSEGRSIILCRARIVNVYRATGLVKGASAHCPRAVGAPARSRLGWLELAGYLWVRHALSRLEVGVPGQCADAPACEWGCGDRVRSKITCSGQ
ncbi:MAG: hypothetical protein JWR69_2505 [Pedosphaera sp.]|nr:hypothetical protein [Pedosphaera sp.]